MQLLLSNRQNCYLELSTKLLSTKESHSVIQNLCLVGYKESLIDQGLVMVRSWFSYNLLVGPIASLCSSHCRASGLLATCYMSRNIKLRILRSSNPPYFSSSTSTIKDITIYPRSGLYTQYYLVVSLLNLRKTYLTLESRSFLLVVLISSDLGLIYKYVTKPNTLIQSMLGLLLVYTFLGDIRTLLINRPLG